MGNKNNPGITIRGIRQKIPPGYVIGRTDTGDGQPHLIPMSKIKGTPGADGAPGAPGAPGTDGQGFLDRGAYSAANTYAAYDVVTQNSSTWLATTAHGPGGVGPANGDAGWILWARGWNFVGAWAGSTTYFVGTVATYLGKTYYCYVKASALGNPPSETGNWSLLADSGAAGATGATGAAGADGADGVGVPVGGTTGQVLAKIDGTDYNTEWVDQSGGGAGGVLPLVTGELPGPVFMNDGNGQTIGVPI